LLRDSGISAIPRDFRNSPPLSQLFCGLAIYRAGTVEWRYSTRVHGRPKFLLTLGFFVCVLSNCGGNSCQAFHCPRAKCPAKCKIAEIDNENELAKDDLVSNNGVGLNKISWQQGYILS